MHGWADEPRNHAVVMVTGWEAEIVTEDAQRLAMHSWNPREVFHFVAPTGTLAECIDVALEADRRPFYISDSPTARGAGDVTWTLARILARPEFQKADGPAVVYASIPGQQAAETIVRAGVGAIVTVVAGAEVDNIHQGPITMTGRVHAIKRGDQDARSSNVFFRLEVCSSSSPSYESPTTTSLTLLSSILSHEWQTS